ncbi:MAG TPA: hypothetical protein VKE40_15040 [Gemmataceae bacterium]|nr:hypothetical protein [Gemmataceae bacterium]
MNEITAMPGKAYDYINGHFGTVGLIVTGVAIVVLIVSILIWFDRRK